MFVFCSRTEGSRVGNVRYHVVVAFGVGIDGTLAPAVEKAAPSAEEAVILAWSLGRAYAGAVAFSRTMDVGQGHYGPATVHAVEGLVPDDLRPMCAQHFRVGRARELADLISTTSAPGSSIKPPTVVVRPTRWRR